MSCCAIKERIEKGEDSKRCECNTAVQEAQHLGD